MILINKKRDFLKLASELYQTISLECRINRLIAEPTTVIINFGFFQLKFLKRQFFLIYSDPSSSGIKLLLCFHFKFPFRIDKIKKKIKITNNYNSTDFLKTYNVCCIFMQTYLPCDCCVEFGNGGKMKTMMIEMISMARPLMTNGSL